MLRRLQPDEHIGIARHIAVCHRNVDSFPLHWHNYFEIEIVLSGRGRHMYNGTEYPLKRGDCYLLTPVDFHQVQILEPVELINISFDETCLPEQILQSLPGMVKRLAVDASVLERIIKCAELLEYECESNGPCRGQLLEYLLSAFYRDCPQQGSGEQLKGIHKAITFMELHFREKITLEQLAKLSGYNPTYFSELFRKATGQSYIQRLRDVRLRYAAVLLGSGVSVSDACYASGFGSLSNFLTAFKEKYGVPPSAHCKSGI